MDTVVMVTSMHKLYINYAPFRFVCPFLILIEHVFCYKKKIKFFNESRNEQCLDIYQYTHQWWQMNKKLVWKCTLCIRLPVLKVLVCISIFCICLEILCVKFFLYLWNLQERNACENYHWHLLFFLFFNNVELSMDIRSLW